MTALGIRRPGLPIRTSGRRFTTGVSSWTRPSSTSFRTRAAVNVLLMLAIEKAVSAVTARRAATSANPVLPVQWRPSGQVIVTLAPGRR